MHTGTSTRIAEITSWLKSRTTVAEATQQVRQFEDVPDTRSQLQRAVEWGLTAVTGLWVFRLYWRLKDGPHVPGAVQFAEWAKSHMLDGDELWTYDTGGDSWEMLMGECGFAIVRNDVVVDFWVLAEN
mgnify:FL=1